MIRRLVCAGLVIVAACSGEPEPEPELAEPWAEPPETIGLDRYDPQRYRPDELSLAGAWAFAFDPGGDGEARGLHRSDGAAGLASTIAVPFPWQSVASGIGPSAPVSYTPYGSEMTLNSTNGVAWYGREVTIPSSWPPQDRILLRFGAVDWRSSVWLNGAPVGEHVGGYTPFTVDLTGHLAPGETGWLAVRVDDPCAGDDSLLVGKQGGLWYTCAGGIWQDVTLEHRPATHLAGVVDHPYAGDGRLRMTLTLAGDTTEGAARVALRCDEAQCGGPCGPFVHQAPLAPVVEVALEVGEAAPWRPDRPCLLLRSIEVRSPAGRDVVLGFTALRQLRIDWAPGQSPEDGAALHDQYKAFYVGDQLLYVRGVLDQAYHPETLTAWPDRAFRVAELARVGELGFNAVRMHIKPEEPFVYAACDVLGLMLIYDMPAPRDFAPSGPDSPWRPHFASAMEALIDRDRNHPSLLWWVLFNEAWGLLSPPFWDSQEGVAYVRGMAAAARAQDPGRPVEGHSPGGFSEIQGGALPHVDTDVSSYHLYDRSVSSYIERLQTLVDGTWPGSKMHVWGPDAQSGQPLVLSEMGPLSATDVAGDLFYALHGLMNATWRQPKVRGWVFTQLTDLEWETNGVLRYDRADKVSGLEELGLEIRDLFSEPYLTLGDAPAVRAAPGETVTVAWGVGGSVALVGAVASFELGPRGEPAAESWDEGLGDVGPSGFAAGPSVGLVAPASPGVHVLRAELRVGEEIVARNGMYIVVDGSESPVDALAPDACAGDCALEWTLTTPGPGTYQLALMAELATVDPSRAQTDATTLPSTVTVRVAGVVAAELTVEDAPHDHRGVLTLLDGGDGAYGQWVELGLGEHVVADEVTLRLEAIGHGVRVFGSDTGRVPSATRLVFQPAP